jgi:FAD/FMN-containing dehydrogenase
MIAPIDHYFEFAYPATTSTIIPNPFGDRITPRLINIIARFLIMATTTQLADLESFLQENPKIHYIAPSSPDYADARIVYNASRADNPLAIVQPQCHSDVCALIKYAKRKSLPFTLRVGGHNLEGRAVVEDALLIDLRALTGVTVAPDQKCATIQGGTLQGEVGNTLWAAGLGTPIGLIPSVGYAGWAVYGGYGPFSAHWGLGVDQIIAATVVNPDGEIIQADEAFLEGIRGAGGLYGVILELVVKVYPISKVRPWYSDPNY